MSTSHYLVVLVALTAVMPTTALATVGCNSLWALEYAREHGLANCQVATVACDSDEDGAEDDLCTVNELLSEFHEDALFGERVDTDGDGVVDAYPGDIVPSGGDGSLNTVSVPLCADGSSSCPGEELRCVDGTRPVYYVDPADDPTSTKWLIAFQGGGSCARTDTETGGEVCWDRYDDTGERGEMSTAVISGTTIQPQKRSINIGGIFDDRPANDFNDFHRIKIDKCTYDRSVGTIMRTHLTGPGRAADPDTLTEPMSPGKPMNAAGERFNLPFHGWLVVEAVLEDLRSGKTVDVYADGTSVLLPHLEDADVVLIGGHSGGSVGLTSKVDRMAEHMAAWGSTADVLGLFDARGKPGLDQELARSFGAVGDNMYDFNAGAAACVAAVDSCLPGNGLSAEASYDESIYDTGGRVEVMSAYWAMEPDDSCLSTHGGVEDWRCHDAVHVLFNHVATPFFMRQAQRDGSHLGKTPEFSLDPSYLFGSSQYRARTVDQIVSMRDERNKAWADRDWEERLYGWAQTTNRGMGAFYPNETKHSGMYHDGQFFSTYLEDAAGTSCVSYHDALHAWVDNTGEEFWVEGVDGVVAAVACP